MDPDADSDDSAPSDAFASTALWDLDLCTNAVTWGGDHRLWETLGSPPADRGSWLERVEAEHAEVVRRKQQESCVAGAPGWSVSYRLQSSDATLVEDAFVARDGTKPVRVVGSVSLAATRADRVRRPTLRELLEYGEERFRLFVETIPQLAWQATPDGWVYFHNQRWYDYTGSDSKACGGWGWIAAVAPEEVGRVFDAVRQAFQSGDPWEDELRLRRASDGMLRWHLARALPLRDRKGRILQWFGTYTDIHDQKRAFEVRSALLMQEREARRRAEEANRAKDEFLAVVSHELRSPLNVILGWAQLLRAGTPSLEKSAQAIERIESSAKLQAKLVEDLLDVSRIIGGKLQIDRVRLDLSRVVQAAVDALRPLADRARVEVRLVGRPPKLTVEGSAPRLQQIVTNLVENAVKFSKPGQTVDVSLTREGSEARIDVVDEGEGIEPDFLPRLFQRFGQADSTSTRRHGGLGLGLSIVHRLVELHAGSVEVHSGGRGRGSRFTVRLPRKGATGDVPKIADENVDTTLVGVDVLAVDDEEAARELLRETLSGRGAAVRMADSAADAMKQLRDKLPDVLVSDIGMPEVDGFELATQIRRNDAAAIATLPLVALTAYASVADRDRARAHGFDAYATKPLEPDQLIRTIVQALRRRGTPGPAQP